MTGQAIAFWILAKAKSDNRQQCGCSTAAPSIVCLRLVQTARNTPRYWSTWRNQFEQQ